MIIRGYRPSDEAAVYEVCLRTGDDGHDAAPLFADGALLGHVFAGPYLHLEPELAFVAEDDAGRVAGYVLGAADTRAFEERCEREWWPPLRARYPDPAGVPAEELVADQRMCRWIHHPPTTPAELLAEYPSHLHIDLLPRAQGQGVGRRLMEVLFAELAAAGSPGVHLGVSALNTGAIAFYKRLDFAEVRRGPDAVMMTRKISARSSGKM